MCVFGTVNTVFICDILQHLVNIKYDEVLLVSRALNHMTTSAVVPATVQGKALSG